MDSGDITIDATGLKVKSINNKSSSRLPECMWEEELNATFAEYGEQQQTWLDIREIFITVEAAVLPGVEGQTRRDEISIPRDKVDIQISKHLSLGIKWIFL